MTMEMQMQMRELSLQEIEIVCGGDAAAARINGANSWGDIINEERWLGAQCQAVGFPSWYCFDYAMKYGSSW